MLSIRTLSLVALCAGVVVASAVLSTAQDKKGADKMPPEMAEMMEKPGAEHDALAPLVGSWDAALSFSMGPGMPSMTSKGTYEVRSMARMWNIGDFSGTLMGQPFQGMSVLGYDKKAKQYVSYWYDSSMSSQMSSTGTWDPAKKTFTMKGKGMSMTGEMVDQTEVTELKDNDTVIFKMLQPGPDKKDMVMMTIEYKRKK